MRTPRWSPWLAAVVLLLSACAAPLGLGGSAARAHASVTLDGTRVALEPTSCALVGGRLLEQLPPGGTETTLTATGRLEDGQEVTVTVRRGTDEAPPEVFELLEVTLGSVEEEVRTLVGFRGLDRSTGTWHQIDPDVAAARRRVSGGFVEVDGARLHAAAALPRPSDGALVEVVIDVTCPLELEPAPGTA
ncbi:MAG: hypothetical protein ACLFUG_03420 [Nitriliruptoraceae bacterium]